MSVFETLGIVVDALDGARIPHMLAGSLASTYHGEPRTTQDFDLVIDPPSQEALARFVAALDPKHFCVGEHQTALDRRQPFNVIDTTTGWKVDLFLRRDREYSRVEFARRQPAQLEGVRVHVATAEDTILTKLEWAKAGESERQLRDVRAILRATGAAIDRGYLTRWAESCTYGPSCTNCSTIEPRPASAARWCSPPWSAASITTPGMAGLRHCRTVNRRPTRRTAGPR